MSQQNVERNTEAGILSDPTISAIFSDTAMQMSPDVDTHHAMATPDSLVEKSKEQMPDSQSKLNHALNDSSSELLAVIDNEKQARIEAEIARREAQDKLEKANQDAKERQEKADKEHQELEAKLQREENARAEAEQAIIEAQNERDNNALEASRNQRWIEGMQDKLDQQATERRVSEELVRSQAAVIEVRKAEALEARKETVQERMGNLFRESYREYAGIRIMHESTDDLGQIVAKVYKDQAMGRAKKEGIFDPELFVSQISELIGAEGRGEEVGKLLLRKMIFGFDDSEENGKMYTWLEHKHTKDKKTLRGKKKFDSKTEEKLIDVPSAETLAKIISQYDDEQSWALVREFYLNTAHDISIKTHTEMFKNITLKKSVDEEGVPKLEVEHSVHTDFKQLVERMGWIEDVDFKLFSDSASQPAQILFPLRVSEIGDAVDDIIKHAGGNALAGNIFTLANSQALNSVYTSFAAIVSATDTSKTGEAFKGAYLVRCSQPGVPVYNSTSPSKVENGLFVYGEPLHTDEEIELPRAHEPVIEPSITMTGIAWQLTEGGARHIHDEMNKIKTEPKAAITPFIDPRPVLRNTSQKQLIELAKLGRQMEMKQASELQTLDRDAVIREMIAADLIEVVEKEDGTLEFVERQDRKELESTTSTIEEAHITEQ